MAVTSYARKTQQQVNINRPQTTGKMRVNYTAVGGEYRTTGGSEPRNQITTTQAQQQQ